MLTSPVMGLRIKGRPHYYATKKEEYAQIRFDLDAGTSSPQQNSNNDSGANGIILDLSPLFNWNTKQLFVYVYAAYSSSDDPSATPQSQSIIWDSIIEAPESPYSFRNLRERFLSTGGKSSAARKASNKNKKNSNSKTKKAEPTPGVLRLRDQKSKYQISDITGKMAERSNVTLAVGWNVQPWVGALWWAPGTGAVPRTEGKTGETKAFTFPALKGSKPKGEQAASV